MKKHFLTAIILISTQLFYGQDVTVETKDKTNVNTEAKPNNPEHHQSEKSQEGKYTPTTMNDKSNRDKSKYENTNNSKATHDKSNRYKTKQKGGDYNSYYNKERYGNPKQDKDDYGDEKEKHENPKYDKSNNAVNDNIGQGRPKQGKNYEEKDSKEDYGKSELGNDEHEKGGYGNSNHGKSKNKNGMHGNHGKHNNNNANNNKVSNEKVNNGLPNNENINNDK